MNTHVVGIFELLSDSFLEEHKSNFSPLAVAVRETVNPFLSTFVVLFLSIFSFDVICSSCWHMESDHCLVTILSGVRRDKLRGIRSNFIAIATAFFITAGPLISS